MLDRLRQSLRFGRTAAFAEEGFHDEINHVTLAHESGKAPYERERLDRIMRKLVDEQPSEAPGAFEVNDFAGKTGRIDPGALEVLEPVLGIIDQTAAVARIRDTWGARGLTGPLACQICRLCETGRYLSTNQGCRSDSGKWPILPAMPGALPTNCCICVGTRSGCSYQLR